MNKKNLLFSFLLVFLISCNGKKIGENSTSTARKKRSTDTLFIKKSCAIYIKITPEDISELKKKYSSEDDFYTMADDANFYQSESFNFLNKHQIELIAVSHHQILNFNNEHYLNTDSLNLWDIVLYKSNSKPIRSTSIDIEDAYNHSFHSALRN